MSDSADPVARAKALLEAGHYDHSAFLALVAETERRGHEIEFVRKDLRECAAKRLELQAEVERLKNARQIFADRNDWYVERDEEHCDRIRALKAALQPFADLHLYSEEDEQKRGFMIHVRRELILAARALLPNRKEGT